MTKKCAKSEAAKPSERAEQPAGKPLGRKKKATKKATPRKPGQNGRPPLGTADWTETFLSALLEGSHVRDACKVAVVNHGVAYRRRDEDESFRLAWAKAIEIGTDALEAEAARRAYHGTLKPVFHKGEVCGHVREYSDGLLQFLLRAREPGKYRDNQRVEHAGPDGGVIPISIVRFNRHQPATSNS